MPIDVDAVVGKEFEPSEGEYTKKDVILYALGLGVGVNQSALSPEVLQYTYEGYKPGFYAVPTFGVIPVFRSMAGLFNTPGLEFNPAMMLHGEQDIEIHRPLPTAAELESEPRIAGIYDKGKAALVVLEVATREKGGEPLFTNRFSLFLRGEGGFGGESGPKAGNLPPEREPDHVVESPTLPQQALLYRLCGDKNPLHADPEFAKMGGFDTPILHGLCSFGMVCKAVVDAALEGDTSKVTRYQARFAGVMFPGETIVTSLWKEGDKILVNAKTKERGTPVITNSAVTISS